MRIGMLADIYTPHVSGVTRYIQENRRILEEYGHEVTVFTFGAPDTAPEAGVIRSPGLPISQAGFYFNFHYSKKAKKTLFEMDVVHCHHPFISGRLAIRYCRPLNIPIVFTNHTRYDLYIKSYLPLVPDMVGDAFLQAFMPSFCNSMNAVISPSEGIKDVLEDMGVDSPIQVIPNGVDLTLFTGSVTPADRADFGFLESDFIFVFVGRLAQEKNLIFLLNSFAGVAQDHPSARLLLVGIGPQHKELEIAVRDLGLTGKVRFGGVAGYTEIPRLLSMCDAFATASISEVHPLSVIEAMACGLPVIAIASPGISDTVEDGATGYLTIHDNAAYTARMASIIRDEKHRKQMAMAAREAVRCYDLAIHARKLEELYGELVKASKEVRHGIKYNVRRAVDRWRN